MPSAADSLIGAMRTPQTSAAPTPPQKSAATNLLETLAWGKKLLDTNTATRESSLQWARRVRFALLSIFGKEAPIVKDLDALLKGAQSKGLLRDQFAQRMVELESLLSFLNSLGAFPLACRISRTSPIPSTKDVFIIHGHDELNTRRLSQLLQGHFGLNPIAMLAKPGMSRPLTEKFEEEAQTCTFAFALFTPDDQVVMADEAYKQARPNVIYEIGWFIGRLGRPRVVLILKSGTRIHSDLDGVSRIQFSENVEEQFIAIQKELKAASIIK